MYTAKQLTSNSFHFCFLLQSFLKSCQPAICTQLCTKPCFLSMAYDHTLKTSRTKALHIIVGWYLISFGVHARVLYLVASIQIWEGKMSCGLYRTGQDLVMKQADQTMTLQDQVIKSTDDLMREVTVLKRGQINGTERWMTSSQLRNIYSKSSNSHYSAIYKAWPDLLTEKLVTCTGFNLDMLTEAFKHKSTWKNSFTFGSTLPSLSGKLYWVFCSLRLTRRMRYSEAETRPSINNETG